jgi:putative hydrolase of the HAD superfamily
MERKMSEKTIPEIAPCRCSVFLTPAPDDFSRLSGLIGELSGRFDVPPFEPHVTVYSGLFPDPALLQTALVGACAGVLPFDLRVRWIGCTPDYFKTLFIEFEEDATLRGLHERVKAGCGVDTGYTLFPHLSLLYAELPLREKEDLARRLTLDRATVRFDEVKVVTPLNVAAGWRDTLRWKTLRRVKLAGDLAGALPRAILFDFGGVIATEGFREGLSAIARRQGLDPEEVCRLGADSVYESGYVLGRGSEAEFWELMRERAGIRGADAELSGEILARFAIRPRMLEAVRRLRRGGVVTVILSDQTDWLERLDARDHFFGEFDRVFNSYRLGKGKRDSSVFAESVAALGLLPHEALFVDDLPANVERARGEGVPGMLFTDEECFLAELERLLGRACPAV